MTEDNTTANADVAAANQAAAGSTLTGANTVEPGMEGNGTAPAAASDTLNAESNAAGAPATSGSAPAADKADAEFVNDPTTQQPGVAGTSGAAPGTNTTGMNSEQPVLELSPNAAASAGAGNAGVDATTASNVNVRTPAEAVHPIVQVVSEHTAVLKSVVAKQPQSVWLDRALKDLQTFEEWVVQHFEEMKRKL